MKKKTLKTFLVSLTIKHSRKSLSELSAAIKLPYSKGSCNKGDLIHGNKKAKNTVWIYYVNTKKIKTLDKCIEKLIFSFNHSSLKASRSVPRDWDAHLDVAVLYKTYTCSLVIQAKQLKWFSIRNIGLSISCYPTS